jgi:hypothetical protein
MNAWLASYRRLARVTWLSYRWFIRRQQLSDGVCGLLFALGHPPSSGLAGRAHASAY